MASISLKSINKTYISKKEQFEAVSDFNLEIKDKEFIVLVGPSGCGKSTTLRMIAGLEDITSGELKIGDRIVNDVQPKDRDIAMVFQNYSLYPHMNVYQNMQFSLTMRKMSKAEIDRCVHETAKILDIEHLLKRKPKALSGGQRQRVALGRAIVRNPKVFLLDEPLSNLDAKLRTQMRAEISKLHNRVGTTFVYVTHDQTEAMTMADRIVVMKDGLIQQVDTPENLYNLPANVFVAGFIGSPQMNFIKGVLKKQGNDFCVDMQGEMLILPESKNKEGALDMNIERKVTVGLRPEDITECFAKKTNSFSAPVEISEMMGSEILVYFEFAGSKIIAKFPASSDVRKKDTVDFYLNAEKAHIFDGETGNSITN